MGKGELNTALQLEYTKKNQSKMKNSVTEMKNTLEGINHKLGNKSPNQNSRKKNKLLKMRIG